MKPVKLLFAIGMRSESIRLAPVISAAQYRQPIFQTAVLAATREKGLIDDLLGNFGITPDIFLHIDYPNSRFDHGTSELIRKTALAINAQDPDVIVIQGGTPVGLATGLNGFFAGKKVAVVGPGIHSNDKGTPIPEKISRRLTAVLADCHFAPNRCARDHLITAGFDGSSIFVAGDTAIDALRKTAASQPRPSECLLKYEARFEKYNKLVLIAGHHRTASTESLEQVWKALKLSAMQNPKVAYAYVVEPDSEPYQQSTNLLSAAENFHFLPRLPYSDFCRLLQLADFVVTDSDEIQAEAPALGKPVLVTGEAMNHPGFGEEDFVKVVGHDFKQLLTHIHLLLHDASVYGEMTRNTPSYGDGRAADRIVDILQDRFACGIASENQHQSKILSAPYG